MKHVPVAHFTLADATFAIVAKRAAQLICTAPEFDALAKEVSTALKLPAAAVKGVKDAAARAQLRAELDALIAQLYGLTEVVLRVPEIVVADIFYTLTAPMMKIPRATAARQLAVLLQQPGIDVENRKQVLDTLGLCEAKNIDYGDAALIVFAKSTVQQLLILSYDQDFAKVPDITAFTPVEWLQTGRKLLK